MNTVNENKRPYTRRNEQTSVGSLIQEHGKIPPQALDLEEAVLGSMMLEKNALTAVIDVLNPKCFYKDAHQKIYNAIVRLFNKSEPIDILTVTHELKSAGELELAGGPFYISQLTSRVASSAHIETHARIIIQKYLQRELIQISSTIIKEAYEDTTDILELLDKAETRLFEVTEGNIRKNIDTMSQLITQVKKEIEKARDQKEGVIGVPSGFTELDRITSGWQRSDMVVIAARPGMGKTAFVLSVARNAAVDFGKAVALFSLEMSSVQLVTRLIASETELEFDKLKKGKLEPHEWEQLNSKITKLSEAPIFIDDTPALSVFELRAKCRRLKAQHDIQLIIIDYLQLMTAAGEGKGGGGNREQEISTISRSLKRIAKELDVPVIALSQLSRAVETRGGDKKPMLSDLRESGAIEQDADMVQFIYRPEYYGITEDEEGNSLLNQATIIIAKHRNGKLAEIPLRFIGHLAKFTDLNHFEPNGLSNINEFNPDLQSITRPSKLNDIKDYEDEPPF